MTLQVKIGLTLGALLVLGAVFALDAVTKEQALTGAIFGWNNPAPLEAAGPFDHLIDIVHQRGFSTLATGDKGFLSDVLPSDLPQERVILLQDGDRAAFLEWIQTTAADRYFLILKTVLYESFSENVHGVNDEEWNAFTHVLTFQDPALGEEWFIFVRLDDQLLEFRVPHNMLALIHGLILDIASSFH